MIGIDQDKMIFVDESGFNLHVNRKRGRSIIGIPATIETTNSRGGNISICAALSPTEGLIFFKVKAGAFNSDEYVIFLKSLFKLPQLRRSQHYIIQDNVPFHKTKDVGKVFSKYKHIQKFLPPYSPQLNPIEFCFSKWKAYIKRNEKSDKTQLIALMEEAAQTITAEDEQGWYREVARYHDDCAASKELSC